MDISTIYEDENVLLKGLGLRIKQCFLERITVFGKKQINYISNRLNIVVCEFMLSNLIVKQG